MTSFLTDYVELFRKVSRDEENFGPDERGLAKALADELERDPNSPKVAFSRWSKWEEKGTWDHADFPKLGFFTNPSTPDGSINFGVVLY